VSATFKNNFSLQKWWAQEESHKAWPLLAFDGSLRQSCPVPSITIIHTFQICRQIVGQRIVMYKQLHKADRLYHLAVHNSTFVNSGIRFFDMFNLGQKSIWIDYNSSIGSQLNSPSKYRPRYSRHSQPWTGCRR
jgi:hypothetical protein